MPGSQDEARGRASHASHHSIDQFAAATAADCAAQAKLLSLDEGLYALSVGHRTSPSTQDQIWPMVQIACPPSAVFDRVEVLGAWDDQGGWIGPEGGTVVVRVPPGGGQILASSYEPSGEQGRVGLADLEIQRIDRTRRSPRTESHNSTVPKDYEAPLRTATVAGEAALLSAVAADDVGSDPGLAAPLRATVFDAGRLTESEKPADETCAVTISEMPVMPSDIALSVSLHLACGKAGEIAAGQWGGSIGSRQPLDGFAITASGPPGVAVRYRAFGPGGRETPWTSGGAVCGNPNRGVPLTGFAVVLEAPSMERYSVAYQGSFCVEGVTSPCEDGEICVSRCPDDWLEAMNVWIVEHRPSADSSSQREFPPSNP